MVNDLDVYKCIRNDINKVSRGNKKRTMVKPTVLTTIRSEEKFQKTIDEYAKEFRLNRNEAWMHHVLAAPVLAQRLREQEEEAKMWRTSCSYLLWRIEQLEKNAGNHG